MPRENQTPPSHNDILRAIVRCELNHGRYMFKHPWLDRELIIGLIGTKGDGKSFGAAIIAIVEFGLDNIPIFSNLDIKQGIEVPDAEANSYGFKKGGNLAIASQKLERDALLKLDERYRNGCLVIDEINMEFAEARRATSNNNLATDRMVQEIRHLKMSLIYTVIHEMWIDNRIRDMTDIFIRTQDTALSPEGLQGHKPAGVDFRWEIYPMTRYLNGMTYSETGKKIGPIFIHAKPFQGCMDSYKLQAVGTFKYGKPNPQEQNVPLPDVREGETTFEVREKWGWLYDRIMGLHDQGVDEIDDASLWDYLQITGTRRTGLRKQVGIQLGHMGIAYKYTHNGEKIYQIPNSDLDKPVQRRSAELVLR